MVHQIECCFVNRLNGNEIIFSELEKKTNISIQTFSCIGNCHHCAKVVHCIMDGERITAPTSEQLYEKIAKKSK